MVDFTAEKGMEVCALIAEGKSLREIEKLPDMPTKNGILKWLFQGEAYIAAGATEEPKALFVGQYAHAKEFQAEALAEECLEIADSDGNDFGFDEEGKPFLKFDNVQRSRLQVDTRKWLAGKLRPKKYGDKLQTDNKTELSGGITVNKVNYADKA